VGIVNELLAIVKNHEIKGTTLEVSANTSRFSKTGR